ncbi:MAG TPA: D-aminoacyl-tRNA deacylase [Methylomusa anaerophila]|uniref:D-aminoacyl-tRNA deacylase n=1 Tax=Methylomusa anaerophila TaxID=1930071 RepID=A0A348AP78_9FIRM|nr:D-aminoacyl-tRNA deacylase [Methylomusa anaerophila]BBB92876.1 D-tyrosyl-tRNA(Tyr) deacylase [Methylomusa anaerophila]HML87288.1 D-aminoacyl-tRNA deacylase [Methylomusa anaerophila]
MRAVVQRTDQASVTVDGQIIAGIKQGLTVFLGIGQGDTEQDAIYLAEKIVNLRIFPDEAGKMNLSLKDVQGDILVISQFTLFGDCRKGRRPGFDGAAPPLEAKALYEKFSELCRQMGVNALCGQFQAEMLVHLTNHGPVTMLLDSKRTF